MLTSPHTLLLFFKIFFSSNPKGGRECDVWPHTPSTTFWHLPPRKDVINQCLEFGLAPVWYLRVVIWFCFLISSLVCFLPSPLALSVMSFFLLMVHFPAFFPQKILTFFAKTVVRVRHLCNLLSSQEMIVCRCSLLPYATGILLLLS